MQPSLRTAAAKYASLGYGVIPLHWIKDDGKCSCGRVDCEYEGKHPLGEHGASNPMLDAELVTAQWEDTPEANIGLVAGASRRVIIDLDSLAAKDHLKDICDLDTHTAMMTAPANTAERRNECSKIWRSTGMRGHGTVLPHTVQYVSLTAISHQQIRDRTIRPHT